MPASNGGTLFGGAAAEPRTGAVYVVAHDNPGIVRLLRPGEGRGFGGPPVPPGQARLPAELPGVPRRQPPGHRHRRAARARRRRCRRTTSSPARLASTRAAIRAVLATGKNRMPPFPHLSAADVDNLVSVPDAPPAGRTRTRRISARPRRRPGGIRRAARTDCRIGIGVGAARRAGGGRGRGAVPYPEGTPDYTRYTINEYNTVGNRIKPPFTTIVKFDLNDAGHQVAHPASATIRRWPRAASPAPARRRPTTASSSPRPASCSAPASTTTSAPGTATPGQAAVVVAVRRQLHRLAGDVRDGRQAVPARCRRECRGWTRRRRRRSPAGGADGLGRLRAPRAPLIGRDDGAVARAYLPTSVLTR